MNYTKDTTPAEVVNDPNPRRQSQVRDGVPCETARDVATYG